MKTPPWWDDAKTPIAFLVAPFAVPLMAAFYLSWYLRWPPADVAFGLMLVFSTFVAYAGTFVFGLPMYRFLCARRLTAYWIAPVVGFIAGAIMWQVTIAVFALLLGNSTSSIVSTLGGDDASLDALRLGGLSGAAVGTILWLIARPDRRTHQQSQGPQSEA